MIVRDAAEQTIINVSAKFAAGGSATAVGSGAVGKMAQSAVDNPDVMASVVGWADVGVVCGIIVGGGGLLAQIYFHWRRDRRESKLYEAQMSKMGRKSR